MDIQMPNEHEKAQLDNLNAQTDLLRAQAELARAQARATDNITSKSSAQK